MPKRTIEPLARRSAPEKPNLDELERTIGITFRDPQLLLQAVTHRSYLNEHRREGARHNERMEFLGDAVLELAVTTYLYKALSGDEEGRLERVRSSLVNAGACAAAAERLGLDRFIRLSHGERQEFTAGARSRLIIMANTLEAVIAAAFLDRGFGVAELFIHENLIPLLEEIRNRDPHDAKSLFQELAQERAGITPHYRVLSETGPEHDKRYQIGVYLHKRLVAEGQGQSKKEAELEAARNALWVEYGVEPDVNIIGKK